MKGRVKPCGKLHCCLILRCGHNHWTFSHHLKNRLAAINIKARPSTSQKKKIWLSEDSEDGYPFFAIKSFLIKICTLVYFRCNATAHLIDYESENVSSSVMSASLQPHGLQPSSSIIEFSRKEYWSGLPFPSPWDLPNPGINSGLPHCRQILYHLSHQGSLFTIIYYILHIAYIL